MSTASDTRRRSARLNRQAKPAKLANDTPSPDYVEIDLGRGPASIKTHVVVSAQKYDGTRRAAARYLPREAGRGTKQRLQWALAEMPAPHEFTHMRRAFDEAADAQGLVMYEAPIYGLPVLLFCTSVRRGKTDRTDKMCYLLTENDVYLVSAHMPGAWFESNFLCQGLLDITTGDLVVERLYHYQGLDVYNTVKDGLVDGTPTARVMNLVAACELIKEYDPMQRALNREVECYAAGRGDRTRRPPVRDVIRLRVPTHEATTEEMYYRFARPPREGEYVQIRMLEGDRPFEVWTNHIYVPPPPLKPPGQDCGVEEYDPDDNWKVT